MDFRQLKQDDAAGIAEMSAMATEIVREHFDPIIGRAQNDYMIARFQTEDAIREQITHGSQYFFVSDESRRIGFLAFYPRDDAMYLSKSYLYREERGKGYSIPMMDFVIQNACSAELSFIELNVNRHNDAICAYEQLGFEVIRTEKNDIGGGFFMDDYVYRLKIEKTGKHATADK